MQIVKTCGLEKIYLSDLFHLEKADTLHRSEAIT